MSLLRAFGKKQAEIASNWITSGMTFGMCAGVAGLYFTDWKVFTAYIPFYNTKYNQDE